MSAVSVLLTTEFTSAAEVAVLSLELTRVVFKAPVGGTGNR